MGMGMGTGTEVRTGVGVGFGEYNHGYLLNLFPISITIIGEGLINRTSRLSLHRLGFSKEVLTKSNLLIKSRKP